jgi:anti-sigma factor RsiW
MLMQMLEPGGMMMEHEQAVKEMAIERYLLDELTPELREEFEEHLFDCAECSLDLRAGSAFVEEARLQLPTLVSSVSAAPSAKPARPRTGPDRTDWFAWLRPVLARPAFAVPVFAAMLAVIGFQNLSTIPSLRRSAAQPRLTPWVSFHTGTRGNAHQSVPADPRQGAVVLIQTPQVNDYASYSFDLYDQQGKRIWTQTAPAAGQAEGGGGAFSLTIPGAGLEQEPYTLVVSGITPQAGRTEVDRRILDVHFNP